MPFLWVWLVDIQNKMADFKIHNIGYLDNEKEVLNQSCIFTAFKRVDASQFVICKLGSDLKTL